MIESDSVSLDRQAGYPSREIGLDDLRIFLAVAHAGSFRGAAKQLYVSQPTVSRAVARLETNLGAQLLERGARGIVVTGQGEEAVVTARRVLAAVTDLRNGLSPSKTATLQLGATATSARTILAPFLSRWIPSHPEIEVKAIEDDERGLHTRLSNGDCHIAIVASPLSRNLEALLITTAQLIALLPNGHPLGDSDEALTVKDLADEPLLINGDGFPSTMIIRREFEGHGHEPRVVYECSAGQTLAAMAEAGLGIAVFGDTVDLRGFTLTRRPIMGIDGHPLSFDLYASWLHDAVPGWIKEFAIELATSFHSIRNL